MAADSTTGGPIFILGSQRGGTNQILNILRSHPAIYWPQGEFHEVFRPAKLRREGFRGLRKLMRYAPILATAGDVLNLDKRPAREDALRGFRGAAVKAGLADSARANAGTVARYKQAMREKGFYPGETPADRMMCKVMNYNLAFARDLRALYPSARFVGIIRDGRAVCEGQMARRADVEASTALYNFVGERLIALEAEGFPIRTWRFEDLVADAETTTREIYAFCGLDAAATLGVCLQDKDRVLNADSKVTGIVKRDEYYLYSEMNAHMRADANAGALARLTPEARAEITARCGPVLRHFGYIGAEEPAAPGERPAMGGEHQAEV